MNISIIGTGYVGLVSGVCFSEIGHHVRCVDIDSEKIEKLRQGISPIYEPMLEDLMKKNISEGRLEFTDDFSTVFRNANVIYIAVGTPPKADGTADLSFVETVAKRIASSIEKYVVVVIKSTVPVGTNEYVKQIIKENLMHDCEFDIVSNPEFLREGTAISDTFNGDRIIIGAENEESAVIIEELHRPYNIPVFKTDLKSAEMIKYAANAFLATKISFINEISNICEKVGANVEDVALGMGKDKRIGSHFLKAGIGYGGSCFPKDTKALVQIAGNVEHDFELLKSIIKVNNNQQVNLIEKVRSYFGSLVNKKVAVLGLTFKPNTDDMREAASVVIIDRLIAEGAIVIAYDPIANEKAKRILNNEVNYADSIVDAVRHTDCILIATEWKEIVDMDLSLLQNLMRNPVIFDGRNCLSLDKVKLAGINYISIGRPAILIKQDTETENENAVTA